MKWFSKNEPKEQADQITFVCEQDGDIERELKSRWSRYLQHNLQVAAAFLARIRYGDSPDEKVALCLRADGVDRESLVDGVTIDFKKLFKTTQSLDVVFLSPDQQIKILTVAKPFYQQIPHVG